MALNVTEPEIVRVRAMSMIDFLARKFLISPEEYKDRLPRIIYDPTAENSSFSRSEGIITIERCTTRDYAEECAHYLRSLFGGTGPSVIDEFFGRLGRFMAGVKDRYSIACESSAYKGFRRIPLFFRDRELYKALHIFDEIAEGRYPSFEEIRPVTLNHGFELRDLRIALPRYLLYPHPVGYQLAQDVIDRELVDERTLRLIRNPSGEEVYNHLLERISDFNSRTKRI